MAAATDRARFYLEQYVPELQEYERKEIFSRDEIQAIARKRSDFEHILNARGSTPGDYVRYATYEMNLDSLRKKRCKRLGVKHATTFNGQRTVFFILDRATRKFPGDMSLWMQYIEYCKKEKANKKLAKVFTSALRLKPRDWGLWVLAAKHYGETEGDMNTARSYLQRGLRFCRSEKRLYLEYAKLEMVYLAKLAARRKILGLDEVGNREEKATDGFENGEDMVALPDITATDQDLGAAKTSENVNIDAVQRLSEAPAYTGEIPMAIFDAAMERTKSDPSLALEFSDMIAKFDEVPSAERILQHILTYMQTNTPTAPETTICEAQTDLFGRPTSSPEFPSALGQALSHIKQGLARTSTPVALSGLAASLLLPYLQDREELDDGVVKVLEASVRRYVRSLKEGSSKAEVKLPTSGAELVDHLRFTGRDVDAGILTHLIGTLEQG